MSIYYVYFGNFQVIVFRCGHGYHRECVDQKFEARTVSDLKCLRCGRMNCTAFGLPSESSTHAGNAQEGQKGGAAADGSRQVRKRRIRTIVPRLLPKEAYTENNETRSVTVVSTGKIY